MNVMRLRPLFFIISSLMIGISLFSIIKWGFKTSIDFSGGTVWEIKTNQTKEQLIPIFQSQKIDLNSVTPSGQNKVILKFLPISNDQKILLTQEIKKADKDYTDLRFESLGPSLGKELLKKTIYALILGTLALLWFIGSKFKDWTFGLGAIIANFHDAFILIGSFSLLGHFFGAELDALFVTALLTTLSSSVHDTVVTFDRIRELKRQNFKIDWVQLANQAVSETLVRSINNSMTIIFMLTSLVVLGGPSTKWFAAALLIGCICGTYSSTAVAIPFVLFIKKLQKK